MSVPLEKADKGVEVQRLDDLIGAPVLERVPRLRAAQDERRAAGVLEVIPVLGRLEGLLDWVRFGGGAKYVRSHNAYLNYGRGAYFFAGSPALFPQPYLFVQGIAPTKAMAEEVCMIATRQIFYARLPQVKGTAGGVAFLLDEVMPASPAYRWTLNHTMRLDDPLELFPTFIVEAGV